jgi:elongation factor G
MPSYTTEAIRNIGLSGHARAGKTTLLETLLKTAGAIAQTGSVERGSTVSDYDPLEKQHQHSLNATLACCDVGEVHLNFLDTPGLADFRGPTLAALEAVETCAIVVNAQNGVEFSTRRLYDRAASRKLCRMIVINQIDAPGVDLEGLVESIRETFGRECLPINLPAGNASRVVDCFFNPSGESDFSSVAHAHQQIIDQVVEINAETMDRYLEGGEANLSAQELHDAFEACLRDGHVVPICFTSAKTGVGCKEFLDLCVKLLPNPKEGNLPPFQKGDGPDAPLVEVTEDPKAHVVAHVFKIINDAFLGKLALFRIYQGTITRESQLYIGHGRKPFKVAHLFKLRGKDQVEVDRGIPGDILALSKVDDIHFDAVLHDSHDEDHWHLKPFDFPVPMVGLAIEPAARGQEQKLSAALHKLIEEDPCFKVEHHAELNETVIRGLGDLHLKVMIERMRERFNVEVSTRPPRIAYRETVSAPAEGHHRHKKQTGGAGQFGEVYLRIKPLERGAGFKFVNAVVGGAIPGSFIPAIEKGVRQVLDGGAVAGYPLSDVEVAVYDGKHHPVDSKEVAFVSAGKRAFLDAISKARPIVLEPIVQLSISVPDDAVGAITGGLSTKRARISGTDVLGNNQTLIKALAPLAELKDYQTEVKAVSAGRGSYAFELSHYEPVPGSVQKALIEAYKPKEAED